MKKYSILPVIVVSAVFILFITISCKAEEAASEETMAAPETTEAESKKVVSPEPEELLKACEQGNIEKVETLLEQGLDVNIKEDPYYRTSEDIEKIKKLKKRKTRKRIRKLKRRKKT